MGRFEIRIKVDLMSVMALGIRGIWLYDTETGSNL